MPSDPDPWWEEAVFYQVYPRSFLDSDGDGIGDLAGIRSKLDYLAWLGVDALWLSPVYPSPDHDYGYDPTSLCEVHPALGDLAELDALVSEAHRLGLKVILDWVGNHTSAEHPWFRDASSSRDAELRDWYIWRDGSPDKPPNNWQSAMGGPAWTWHESTQAWYLHLFLSTQPDLNWANPDLAEAMFATLRFWLDGGIDGFRLDVPHCMGKDRTFADNPPDVAHHRRSILNDCAETHDVLRRIRKVVDEYSDNRMTVGEVNLLTIDQLGPYVSGDELHLAFNFPPTRSPWDAAEWRNHIATTERVFRQINAWPTWFLSNHDYPRHRTRYGGTEARARAAAVLLLTLRGTPFLYAGEEIGLEEAVVPRERVLDPIGRDGCRAPIPWNATDDHGWANADPWLPWPPEPRTRNVESQLADGSSILHLYRTLLETRRKSSALRHGSVELLDQPPGVLAFERHDGEDRALVAINFESGSARVNVPEDWRVVVGTSPSRVGHIFDGTLDGDEAVVLQPT